MPTTRESPALRALSVAGIVRSIASFQDGILEDLRPFLGFDYKAWVNTPFDKRLQVQLEPFHALLLPWLADHSIDRLAQLFEALPDVAPLVTETAIYYGHDDLVAHLSAHWRHKATSLRSMDLAAWAGHFPILKRLHEEDFGGCSHLAMDWGARGGHLDIVQFLHEQRREGCTTEAMNWAANLGHLAIVQFLHFKRTEGCTKEALNWSAGNGHLDVVQFLHTHRNEGMTEYGMNMAGYNGHVATIGFLHNHRTEGCTEWAMTWAASQGHMDVVQYLHAHRTEGCCAHTLTWAASRGDFAMAEFLLQHGYCDNKIEAMRHAARVGQFDMCVFLYEDGMDVQIPLVSAAMHGMLDIVKFLVPRVTRHDGWAEVRKAAVDAGHASVTAYLDDVLEP